MISWDEAKNVANQGKHGISFDAAALVFDDPLQVCRAERIENGEQRRQTIGLVDDVALLLVARTWRDSSTGEEQIRIISARRATKQERTIYEQGENP